MIQKACRSFRKMNTSGIIRRIFPTLSTKPTNSTLFSSSADTAVRPFSTITDHFQIQDWPTSTAMFDLVTDPASHSILRTLHASSRIIAAVCHGPAAIAKVKLGDGTFLIANSTVTGFSNAEEVSYGYEKYMPFSLEDALDANSGGGFRKAEEQWGPYVVVAQEGRLMTGQNPASARPLAEAVLERLMGRWWAQDHGVVTSCTAAEVSVSLP